jgi:hypothetical protein
MFKTREKYCECFQLKFLLPLISHENSSVGDRTTLRTGTLFSLLVAAPIVIDIRTTITKTFMSLYCRLTIRFFKLSCFL